VHGVADSKCEGVANLQQYDGMTSFEGSEEDPFCWSDPMSGTLKMAVCPAKDDGGDDSNGEESAVGCPDNCMYDGCYRADFTVPGICDPTSNRCVHGIADDKCEGVTNLQGYDGITNFEGSDQAPFCWSDPMSGTLKMALCPAKANGDDSSGEGSDIIVGGDDVEVTMDGNEADGNESGSGGVTILFAIASTARLLVVVTLALCFDI